ncbi:MAG: HAD-IA family hydrolase [Propionibacteriaceae bacterium]|jgi:phosphoglycolate phosphatase|nr:HAD-IA family hydrolase [Propionibacteriaceae bacterium]
MTYDLIILDLDGTIAHTLPGIAHAAAQVMAQLGYAAPDPDSVQSKVGGGARKLFERLFADVDDPPVDAATERFLAYYNAHAEAGTTLYPDVVETLERLHGTTKLAVCTAKARPATLRIFEHFDILKYFDLVVAMDDMQKPKPDPGGVATILQKLDVDKQKCLYVGDSSTDLQTALNAEVDCWIVDYGYGFDKALALGGYRKIISGFAEIHN